MYSEGIIVYALNMSVCQQTSCHVNTWDDIVTLDMLARIRPLIGAPPQSLPADRKWGAQPCWSGSWPAAITQERTYLWMRINGI